MVESQVLQPVIQNENICLHFLHGEASCLNPVLVYYDLHSLKVLCQHVRFIPRVNCVQQQLFAIADNLWQCLAF